MLPALLVAVMAIGVGGCGGGGGNSAATGRLNVRALWEIRPASAGAGAGEAQTEQSGGFGPTLPAAARTVRFVFASNTGSRCCVAVDPYQTCTDASCERRVLVIDDLPTGPGTIQVSAFGVDFAPTIAGVSETCSIEPADAGRPCDVLRFATPSFDSGPQPVTISAGTETDAGVIAIPAVPFVLDGTLVPQPNSVVASPLPIGFTVADAVTGIDLQSIAVSLTQGSSALRVPLTAIPCNDAGEAPCSAGGQLQVSGFRVASDPQPLDGGPADVSIVARNRASQPRILTLTYTVAVRAPGTSTPTGTSVPTGLATVTPTRTGELTPPPTSTPTPTATPQASRINFIPGGSDAVSPQPEYFAVADFDDDGFDDVAVSSPSSREVNALFGSADGAFTPGTVQSIDGSPGWIAAGDLDGDDLPDLVVADERADAVFIMVNRGNGTFAAPAKRSVGHSPFAVAITNFDGRNGNDLAVSDRTANRVAILLNEGGGTLEFGAGGDYAVGSGPEDLLVRDFNGDSEDDMVTLNNGSGAKSVTLLLFDRIASGLPVFQHAGDFGVGERPSNLSVGDFNNDGQSDLALLNRPLGEDRGEVQFLLGTSGGLFEPGETQRLLCPFGAGEVGCPPRAMAVEDFDRDGNWDLAVSQTDSQQGPEADALSVFAGTGEPSFLLGPELRTGRMPNSMAVADVTGDGLPDIVIGSHRTSTVQLFVNVSAQ